FRQDRILQACINILRFQVGNATEVESYVPQSSSETECLSEFCSENCGLFRASCELHRLRTGVEDLTGLLETDYVSPCDVCVSTAVQAETVEMGNLLESTGDQLIPSTSFYCVQLVLMPLSECGQLLGLLERVEVLTSSMNDSQSLSNLQLVVERLSSSVLPHTRLSLVRHQLAMPRHLASEISLLSFRNPKSVKFSFNC
ncbi:hypothetical protein GBAR_LOCUS26881, partial [Geodia barretti]